MALFLLLKHFGGVPITEKVLDVNSPELFGPRNSRYEVADFIINDLKAAYPDLPKEKNIGSNDKGKLARKLPKLSWQECFCTKLRGKICAGDWL